MDRLADHDANPIASGMVAPDQSQDLPELVWKYFEEEIREAVMEVQEEIQTVLDRRAGQISQRKQRRK